MTFQIRGVKEKVGFLNVSCAGLLIQFLNVCRIFLRNIYKNTYWQGERRILKWKIILLLKNYHLTDVMRHI